MSQALYRKWRPQKWDQVVGQEHVVQTLRNEITAERVAHAYLFAGPRGTGKTTTARLLAKAVNCLDPDKSQRPCDHCEHCQAINHGRFLDLIEIDAASNTSVEDVRSLRDKINFSPNQGQYKVYIIDEVHMLSTAAFNALLKTLEEPPAHAIFILATTEVHKIPATVLSRCQRHEFRRIPVNDILSHLKDLAQGEGLLVDPDAMTLVARQSTGSLRDAISLLDQLASAGDHVTLEMAQAVLGTAASQAVLEVIDALLSQDPKAGLEKIHAALDSGSDPRQFARQIVEYLRSLLLIRMGNADQVEATAEMRVQMARHAQAFHIPDLLRVIRAFNHAGTDARLSWQPTLPLELAFAESLEHASLEGESAAAEPVVKSKPAMKQKGAKGPDRPAAQQASPQNSEPQPEFEPESAEEPQVEEESIPMDTIMKNWSKVISFVNQKNQNTAALLRSGKVLGLKNSVLYFGGLSEVLRIKVEKNENMEIIQEALKQAFGMEIQFRCLTEKNKRSTPPPGVDSDGMVATALRDLGGEIVDIQ